MINYQEHSIKKKVIFVGKVILMLFISFSFSQYAEFYAAHDTFKRVVTAFNTFLTAHVIISFGRYLLISWYLRRNKKNDSVRGSFVLGVNQIAAIVNVAFVIIGLMIAFGIDPAKFLTSITLVAMAIALLFRDYITNMISGLLIMFSDQFTIGDSVKIGENQGKIVDITLSNIVIKNDDEDAILVPNNAAFTTTIINQSLENAKKINIEFHLPLSHAHRQEELHKRLEKVLTIYGERIALDNFQLKIVSVNQDAVHYKINIHVHTRGKMKRAQLKNALLGEVIAFDAEQTERSKPS